MNHELIDAVACLAERLVKLSDDDDGLRDALRRLAELVLKATERPPAIMDTASESREAVEAEREAREPDATATAPDEEAPKIEASAPEAVETHAPLPELTLGRSRPPDAEHRTIQYAPALAARSTSPEDELAIVEAHCRLKAEGVRWALARRLLIDDGAEFREKVAPRDREILDRAGDLGCYLWMNSPNFIVPAAPAPMEGVAEWFDATADAAAVVRRMLSDVEADREHFASALALLAETQSALRVAIDRVGGSNDQDQYRAYDWLRGVAARERIYIPRHMRRDDPADPASLTDVRRRIKELDARVQRVKGRDRRRKSGLGRLRYHARRIGEGNGGEYDWLKISGAVDELIEEGVPASSVEIRESLIPVLDLMPEGVEFSQGFNLVLREIDRYLAGRASTAVETAPDVPAPEVAEVAGWLRGKQVLMIGGVRRPEAHQALKAAFGLADLIWFESREHGSIDVYEPYVARQEVVLVLLAIRWSSHSFGDVKRYCDLYGKPMVRLPGGYGVNQVAVQIVAQCSGRLGDD